MEPISLPMMREHLYAAVVCDALDALGFPNQSPRTKLAPLCPLPSSEVLVGRCRTTLWADMDHEDPRPYELELKAVDACQTDDVFVAAAGGSMRSGIWGELLTTAARNRGCVGAIVDGAIRDVRQIRAMGSPTDGAQQPSDGSRCTRPGFPVFAAGTCIYDSLNRQRVIDIDVAVDVGGVRIAPGDLVIADVDGIVIVPQQVEAEAIQNAWDKVHAENEVRDAIRAGMSATDAFAKYGVL